jgi:hypothetical protein
MDWSAPRFRKPPVDVVGNVSPVFYVTDLRHFDGIELDPDVPAPALAFATYLRRIVRAATASSLPGAHPTALVCRRRPQRRRCPGRLRVERQEVPSCVVWGCPACGEGGRIDGWQEGDHDLSVLERAPLSHGSLRRLVVLETAYPLLLEEESFDRRCAGMVYAARLGRDGVRLSGTEEEFAALSDVVAWGADEPSPSRRRRWRQLAWALEPRGRSWLEHGADVMAEQLGTLGLDAPRPQLAAVINRTLAELAQSLGISEAAARRYLDEERLRDLALEAAFQLAREQPGAALHDLPRNVRVSLALVGRTVSALAEAGRIRLLNDDEQGTRGALELLSLLGQLLHEVPVGESDSIGLPQAALVRAGRLLEGSAAIIDGGGMVGPTLPNGAGKPLAGAFRADAATIGALVAEHGSTEN